jgi:hypothetical protein
MAKSASRYRFVVFHMFFCLAFSFLALLNARDANVLRRETFKPRALFHPLAYDQGGGALR